MGATRRESARMGGSAWRTATEAGARTAPTLRLVVSALTGVKAAALFERRQEEEDERDEQHVDDERLDQHEAEDQRAADVAGGPGVARNRFGGGADAAPLCQRAETGGEGQGEPCGDDRPLGDLGLVDEPPVGSWANTGANTPAAITSANVRTERLLTTQASSEQLPEMLLLNAEVIDEYASQARGCPTPPPERAFRSAHDDAPRRRPLRDDRRTRLPAGK